ncbi:MAG: LytTR family DNA-binding domain-containing protein [Spirochaetaceae bacterium]
MSNDTISVIVVDDELPAREELLHLLEGFKFLKIFGSAKNGLEAKNILLNNKVDIAFLDIQMPGLNGIELAKSLIDKNIETLFIFTTAYNTFAVDAFDVHAVDYLLKPLRLEKLERSINRAKKELNKKDNKKLNHDNIENLFEKYIDKITTKTNRQFLPVYRGEQIIPIKIDTIIFAEAKGRFVWITTSSGEYKTNLCFSETKEILISPKFFTCHRSFIINTEFIEAVELWINNSYRLNMKCSETLIPVSRSRKDELQKLLSI